MKYEETKLTPKQLETLLQNGNPQKYDEIRIIFKTTFTDDEDEIPYIINMTNLNDPLFEIILFEEHYGKHLREWKDVTQEYNLMNARLTDDEKLNYSNIRSVRCWYYSDQTKTDYDGKKLEPVESKEELKQFFQDNKEELKNYNYGGSRIYGVGDKKLRIDYSYYTWNEVYDIYRGKKDDYRVNKIINFLK